MRLMKRKAGVSKRSGYTYLERQYTIYIHTLTMWSNYCWSFSNNLIVLLFGQSMSSYFQDVKKMSVVGTLLSILDIVTVLPHLKLLTEVLIFLESCFGSGTTILSNIWNMDVLNQLHVELPTPGAPLAVWYQWHWLLFTVHVSTLSFTDI